MFRRFQSPAPEPVLAIGKPIFLQSSVDEKKLALMPEAGTARSRQNPTEHQAAADVPPSYFQRHIDPLPKHLRKQPDSAALSASSVYTNQEPFINTTRLRDVKTISVSTGQISPVSQTPGQYSPGSVSPPSTPSESVRSRHSISTQPGSYAQPLRGNGRQEDSRYSSAGLNITGQRPVHVRGPSDASTRTAGLAADGIPMRKPLPPSAYQTPKQNPYRTQSEQRPRAGFQEDLTGFFDGGDGSRSKLADVGRPASHGNTIQKQSRGLRFMNKAINPLRSEWRGRNSPAPIQESEPVYPDRGSEQYRSPLSSNGEKPPQLVISPSTFGIGGSADTEAEFANPVTPGSVLPQRGSNLNKPLPVPESRPLTGQSHDSHLIGDDFLDDAESGFGDYDTNKIMIGVRTALESININQSTARPALHSRWSDSTRTTEATNLMHLGSPPQTSGQDTQRSQTAWDLTPPPRLDASHQTQPSSIISRPHPVLGTSRHISPRYSRPGSIHSLSPSDVDESNMDLPDNTDDHESHEEPQRSGTPIELTVRIQAILDALAARRRRLQKQIHDLEKLEVYRSTRNSMMVTPRTNWNSAAAAARSGDFRDVRGKIDKTAVAKKLDRLTEDLGKIVKEEHENGLRLARAWRRRDWGAGDEGGGTLWVRRVTS